MSIVRQAGAFIALHFRSRRDLIRKLQTQLDSQDFRFTFEFSGRTAILKLALHFKSQGQREVALIPDYICNVVEMAIRQAGYIPQYYATDEMLEPDLTEITESLSAGRVGLLLTGNVFGSSALLDVLHQESFRSLVIQNRVAVIVDLCQDITLVDRLPSGYGELLAAAVSFNDKSLPGVMGAGILAPFPMPENVRRVSARQLLKLYTELAVKLVSGTGLRRKSTKQYEYSHCKRFPYTFDLLRPARIQAILGIIGLQNLRKRTEKKRKYANACLSVRRTRFFETSPFLIVESANGSRRHKASYAIQGDPQQSRRAHLVVIHNKGYWDA